MTNFREWLKDMESRHGAKAATDLSATIDYVPSDNTPSGGGDQTHFPHQTQLRDDPKTGGKADLVSRIVKVLLPVDPHLYDRRADGKVQASFSGSPRYASPEEAKKVFNPTFEHQPDEIQNFLKACAHHFVWLEKDCGTLLKCWIKFRSMLHASNEGVNPVLYQVNLLRLKDFEKHFPTVHSVVQKCEDSEKYADLIGAWNNFYGMWTKLVPTLKHYLVTFEKNAKHL